MNLTNIGGYVLLILLAILAPTPVPIPLDGIILGLIASGFNPTVVLVVAGIGDLIGTFLIYKVGRKGRDLLAEYRKRRKRRDYIVAEKLFHRYGEYALLLGGVPFLGDALIFIAGFYRLRLNVFLLWFLLGKVIWYSLIVFFIVTIPLSINRRHVWNQIHSSFGLTRSVRLSPTPTDSVVTRSSPERVR